ncbi:response regulator [Paracoccus sp. S-4012]|uniref:response regulator n=1 Tax=Paracoccus sp. S-4012 TaxID=2665648 RepID=UPI0012B05EB3|nr:response regulator [Paracoccus sp. S-4012]MRX49964.1 response regulator [Paracoccus sp. S-4012]
MAPAPAPDAPARILVVDDDEANLMAAQAVLAELGHPVFTARSGAEALRAVLREDFAVILLDVRMPGMDGYETAERIRQRERSRHVPIIFLSGAARETSHQFRGYAAGAVDYVLKPAEPLILRSKVEVFAQLYEQRRQIALRAEAERQLMAENLAVRAREAEVARELERTLRTQAVVLEALPLALFVSGPDTDGRSFVGGNVQSLCGAQELEEFEVGEWLARVHPDERPRLEAAIEAAPRTGGYEIEYRLGCGSEDRWMMERADWREDGEDGPMLYGVISDITSRRRLEEQLTHAQKLEAVGQLSGGVAHDFNNMLGVIIGSLDRVLAAKGLDDRTRGRVSLAMQAAESCADLTKRLLGFARRQKLQPRELDVAAALDRIGGLFERVLGETVTASLDIAPDLPPVWLDASQLEGAIVNLVVNARDAMPEGGTLKVTAGLERLEGDDAAGLDLEEGAFIRLSVADTGTGMDTETQVRALEPFFTTKAPDKGTGLGLSSIYGFMRQSGGGLRIESEVGQGTTVHLYLPPMSQPADNAAAQAEAEAADLTGLRVALVEDNAALREVTQAMLGDLGCAVTAYATADEAAAAVDPGAIDLLVTDCVMPGGINGPELGSLMRERRGDLPILFISGFRADADELPTEAAALLGKPFDVQQLRRALSGVLSGAAAEPPRPARRRRKSR